MFEARFKAALNEVREAADLDAVIALFTDTFASSRQPDTAGAIVDGPPDARTRIRRRAQIVLHLAEDGDHIALVAPGGPLSFDREAEPALERLLAGEALSAADFAALGEAKALDAVARLIAYGVAERA